MDVSRNHKICLLSLKCIGDNNIMDEEYEVYLNKQHDQV